MVEVSGELLRMKSTEFAELSSPRANSSRGRNLSMTAVTMVSFAWLGKASLTGGNGDWGGQGFGLERSWSRGENLQLMFVVGFLYRANSCLVMNSEQGEVDSTKGKRSTALPWTPVLGGDEDEFLPFFFNERVFRLLMGWCLGRVCGLVLGCRGGLWRPGESLLPFLFCFYFLFSISFIEFIF
jgi:hypothetical protein